MFADTKWKAYVRNLIFDSLILAPEFLFGGINSPNIMKSKMKKNYFKI